MAKALGRLWEQVERQPHNVHFSDFCRLIAWFGFVRKGGKGSHQTYFHPGVREILDVQPLGGEAKPYQIRQLIRLVRQYGLTGRNEET
ncbi:MAG: type II toxin-antitoxin system HicA family toxin [Deltaproteobacteria bacterium]|nr:type II toxin-antitoxin system HicA family toxin [Deltaproteobacteria bacterium]